MTASGLTERTATTSAEGRFELPLPAEFLESGGRLLLSVEDDEVIGTPPTELRSAAPAGEVVLRIPAPDPDDAPRVRRRMEALRNSSRKNDFSYGMDSSAHLADEDELVLRLSTQAETSVSARKVLEEYQKDPDPQLRALAYGVLAGLGRCEDDADRPRDLRDAADARRLIEWAFRAVSTSKHGGHFEVGVDLDDGCARCAAIFSDCVVAASILGEQAAGPLIDSLGKAKGQPAVLRGLLTLEFRRAKPARGKGG